MRITSKHVRQIKQLILQIFNVYDSRGGFKSRKIDRATRARKGFQASRPPPPFAFSGSVWIKSYMTNLPATRGFPKVAKVGLGGQVVNKAWRRAINHGLSRSRARSCKYRAEIFTQTRVSCAYARRHPSPFNPLVRHHASSTMINVKNSTIKSEKKKRGRRRGRWGWESIP